MDELYTETGKLECFIAPAEIANGQEPWLEQNLTTPKDGIESADRNNTHKVSQILWSVGLALVPAYITEQYHPQGWK